MVLEPRAVAQAPQVSIVMPIHAKPLRLRLTLAAIAALLPEPQFEWILVADNATTEARRIAAQCAPDQLLETPGLGRAGARNLGARAARGELIVFLDDDILVRPDFVLQHVLAQRRRPGLVHGRLREIIGLLRSEDPSLGGPACPPISEEDLRHARWVPDRSTRLVASALEQAAEDKEIFGRAPWLASAGANLSVPKDLWRQVGGFDEAYGLRWGLEDIDFGFRLWKAGAGIELAADATGLHMSHHSPSRWEEQRDNFERFFALANGHPEALALTELLSPTGSLLAYKQRLTQNGQVA